MASQKCSKRYDAILFDAVGTLLSKKPEDFEVLAERCKEVGIILDSVWMETVKGQVE